MRKQNIKTFKKKRYYEKNSSTNYLIFHHPFDMTLMTLLAHLLLNLISYLLSIQFLENSLINQRLSKF